MRAKLIGVVALAVVALALWRFLSGPAVQNEARPASVVPARNATEAGRAPSQTAEPAVELNVLNERTLIGTRWEREGFGLEFGANGKLLIGGRERASWRVEGSRIRLYRDATPAGRALEEHWLDIVGDKLMWEGREIGRVP